VKNTIIRIIETHSSWMDRLLLYLNVKFGDVDWYRREFEEKVDFNYQFLLSKQKLGESKIRMLLFFVNESSKVIDRTLNSDFEVM
jgi:hypothetical protein